MSEATKNEVYDERRGQDFMDKVRYHISNKYDNCLLAKYLQKLGPQEANNFLMENIQLIDPAYQPAEEEKPHVYISESQAQKFGEMTDQMTRRQALLRMGKAIGAPAYLSSIAYIIVRGDDMSNTERNAAIIIGGTGFVAANIGGYMELHDAQVRGRARLILGIMNKVKSSEAPDWADNAVKKLEPVCQQLFSKAVEEKKTEELKR